MHAVIKNIPLMTMQVKMFVFRFINLILVLKEVRNVQAKVKLNFFKFQEDGRSAKGIAFAACPVSAIGQKNKSGLGRDSDLPEHIPR